MKKQTKTHKRTKAPELYFVIGGEVNRTKCATEKDAITHARQLLQERQPLTVGWDISRNGDHSTAAIIQRAYGQMKVLDVATIPKVEQKQCIGSSKPLYIVKVVGVAELVPPPVVVRKPKGNELA